mgnify:CR=1 FL=1
MKKKITDNLKGSFLSGSLLFTLESLKNKPISKLGFIGCMFFNVGCIYYIKDSYK